MRFEFPQENIFDGSFVLGMDVDFRFDDGDKSCRNDLAGVVKLLFDDTADAVFVPFFDDGAHFRTEDMSFFRLREKGVEFFHRFHQLDTVVFFRESFVDFQNRNDAFVPEVVGGVFAVNFGVHRDFEQDSGKDFFRGKGRTLNNPCAHLMDEVKHFFFVAVRRFGNSVQAQRLRRGAAALVECRDKSVGTGHAFKLLLVHGTPP